MAHKVQQEDILNMNNLYLEYHTYAEVARQTGFSPSTVKKYIIPNYIPVDKTNIIKFNKEIPKETLPLPSTPERWLSILTFTEEDRKSLEEIRKEIDI